MKAEKSRMGKLGSRFCSQGAPVVKPTPPGMGQQARDRHEKLRQPHPQDSAPSGCKLCGMNAAGGCADFKKRDILVQNSE